MQCSKSSQISGLKNSFLFVYYFASQQFGLWLVRIFCPLGSLGWLRSLGKLDHFLYMVLLPSLHCLNHERPVNRNKVLGQGIRSDQIRSVAQSCLTLCNPMNRSTPGLPVHHQLPEFTQTHVHRVSDAIQPSHPLPSPSPPAPNPSQHQSLFQGVNSSHEVAKVLEFQL